MTTITTPEELDALPDDVLLEASGTYPSGGTSKCDSCGRFASRLYDIPCIPPSGGIEREVCAKCAGVDRG